MFIRLGIFLLCTHLFSLQIDNVPVFNSQASKVIPFSISKDFSDGALKSSFLKEMRDFFGVEIFVETGTYLGNTTAIASAIFKQVHTVEIFPEFYSKACERFRKHSNVTLYFGSSGILLPEIISKCNEKVLFYLDGHFDGGNSGRGTMNTPILEELAAIKNRSDSIILIDDIADFQDSLYPQAIQNTCFDGYPDLKRLTDELLAINDKYQFCFLGNALLAFPPSSEVTVSPVASSCAIDRFSSIQNLFSEEQLLQAERTIAQAPGFERAELTTYYQAYAPFEWEHGWRSFAAYWYGLILREKGMELQALEIFTNTARKSLPGWRGNR